MKHIHPDGLTHRHHRFLPVSKEFLLTEAVCSGQQKFLRSPSGGSLFAPKFPFGYLDLFAFARLGLGHDDL
jgi:hypothetical protein